MGHSIARFLTDIKPGTLFAGVDLGMDTHMVVVIDQQARQRSHFRVGTDADGFAQLFQRLEQLRLRHAAPEVLLAMEPTGHLWKPLAQAVEGRDAVRYVLVNPLTVHRQREGDTLDRSKDDLRDARACALAALRGTVTPTRLLQGEYAALRHLELRLERLGVEVARYKNRLRADIAVVFPEFRTVFKDLLGLTAQAVLTSGLDPATIAATPLEVWAAQVRGAFRGQRLALSQLRQLHALAARSVGYRPITAVAPLTIRQSLASLLACEAQREELREAIRTTVARLPEAAWALTIPGLGALSLGRLLGHLGDPALYRHSKQLVKLAGTQPVPHTSGRRTRSRTRIAGQGRSGLRSILYYSCLHVLRADDAFRQAYERLQTRPGNALAKMQAIVALMNKLIRVIWVLLRRQEPYAPDKLFQAAAA